MRIIFTAIFLIISSGFNLYSANQGDVVINEIAWMGTEHKSGAEWIELYNTTNHDINVANWKIKDDDGEDTTFTGADFNNSTITAGGYYILEWKHSTSTTTSISDIVGDFEDLPWQWLGNDGDAIILEDENGIEIDRVDCSGGWFAGDTKYYYVTMERIYPDADSNSDINWADNDRNRINGHDSEGNPIYGTPRQKNSVSYIKEVDIGKGALKVTDSPFFPHNDNPGKPAKGMITYKVKENSYVTLAIYDINGYVIKYLKHDVLLGAAEAQGTVFWKGTDTYDNIVPVGIYIVHLKAEHRDTGVVKTAEATIIVGRKF